MGGRRLLSTCPSSWQHGVYRGIHTIALQMFSCVKQHHTKGAAQENYEHGAAAACKHSVRAMRLQDVF